MVYTSNMILGIDEAERGPWAGPLVVGAVVLGGVEIAGLTDSKKLSKKRREQLEMEIIEKAQAVATGWVSAGELDAMGMSAALKLATKRAVEQIAVPYHEIIIDGKVNFLADTTKGRYVTTMPKADLLIPSVSAASIIAKVARDRYMKSQDIVFPGYGFGCHAGYGVAAHRAAIEKLGVTPLHRLSFAPLVKYHRAESNETKGTKTKILRTTRVVGNESESVAAMYLQSHLGHAIRERNWRTKWCEIDIVSEKGDTLYFTEVKHRKDDKAGGGIAAITPKKLKQMKFAAELFGISFPERQLRLAVITTSGNEVPVVDDFLELL